MKNGAINEDNVAAHAFCLAFGFIDINMREKDDQGNPYPLISMRLSE